MARKKGRFRPKRLPLSLIEPIHKRLEKLVASGGYGNNPSDAAKIIIMRHLQVLDQRNKVNLFDGVFDVEDGNKNGDKK